MPRHPVAAACLVAVCFACGSTLDAEGLEDEIEQQLADRYPGEPWTVTCPEDVEPAAGDTFRCDATSGDGRSLAIEVTQDDARGSVVWRVAQ